MAVHVIVPTTLEPSVVATIASPGASPTWRLISPQQESASSPNELLVWLESLTLDDIVVTTMQSNNEGLIAGAAQRAIDIRRISFFELGRYAGNRITVPPLKLATGAGLRESTRLRERIERVARLMDVWLQSPGQLFPYTSIDARISALRVIMAELYTIQRKVRIPLELREHRLKIDQSYMLAPDHPSAKAYGLRVTFLAKSDPIAVLKEREEELELEAMRLLRGVPAWTEVLKTVRGIGPRIGSMIVGSIVDIRRFERLSSLKQYAGWSVINVNGREQIWRFVRQADEKGIAGANVNLRGALWQFGNQITRVDSQFKFWYAGYKQKFGGWVGQPIYYNEKNEPVILTKAWLDSRARCYAVSKFLRYLFLGWWELQGRTFDRPKASELLKPETIYNAERLFAPAPYRAPGVVFRIEITSDVLLEETPVDPFYVGVTWRAPRRHVA